MWEIESGTPIKLAIIEMQNLSIKESREAYKKLEECASEYAENCKDINIGNVDGVRNARQLFRSIGIDPTKHRPSSEALLRRAIKGKDFFSINTLVDIGNWCSLDFLLPICVYDSDKIVGNITARLGKKGESYFGHNNREVNLHDRYLIADEKGPFGSPITDSKHTAVNIKTRNALLIIFAPENYDEKLLKQQAEIFAERVQSICGGDVADLFVFS